MSKNAFFFLIGMVSFTSIGIAEAINEKDTVLANGYFAFGDSLLKAAKYDSAVVYFEKAEVEFKKNNLLDKSFRAVIKLSKCYRVSGNYNKANAILRLLANEINESIGLDNETYAICLAEWGNLMSVTGKHDSSIVLYRTAMEIEKKVLKKGHSDITKLESGIGFEYSYLGKTDSALLYLNSALKNMRRELGDDHKDVGEILTNVGLSYFRGKMYDSAIYYHLKALEIWKHHYDEISIEMGFLYNNLGTAHSEMGMYERSVEYYQRSLIIVENVHGKEHPYVALLSANMARDFRLQGRFNLSLEYFEKALNIFKEKFKNGHQNMSALYGEIGAVYLDIDSTKLALQYFLKSSHSITAFIGENHPDLAMEYIRIATTYTNLGRYNLALKYFDNSYTNIKNNHSNLHIDLASYHQHIADFYIANNELTLAQKNLELSLDIYEKLLRKPHPTISSILETLGKVHLEKEDYLIALKYYQQALIANNTTFSDRNPVANPKIGNSLNRYYLLSTLNSKSKVLEKIYLKEQHIDRLVMSFNTLQLGDSLVDILRNKSLKYEDKTNFGAIATEIYETAIRVSLLLYEQTKQINYLHHAFYFAEKSKSETLSNSINTHTAKKPILLPDGLSNLERDIKVESAYYKTQILNLESHEEGYDTTRYRTFENRIFQLNRQHDSLIQAFERNYLGYYQLKYQNNTISVGQVQRQIPKNSALIEYFDGDSVLYAFVITAKNYQVFTTANTPDIQAHIIELRNSLELDHNDSMPKKFRQFSSAASKLGNFLLYGPLNYISKQGGITHLTIIPDGKLNFVPFEVLLTKVPVEENYNYSELDYLINEYSVNYGYSATLNFSRLDQDTNHSKAYLGYAPSYQNVFDYSSSAGIAEKFRENTTNLIWNQKEVEEISDQLQGTIYTTTLATETNFKQQANDYSIIHLAMHAFVDHQNPMNSKLVFDPSNDSINDGFLHAYEIFNMEIKPKMIVLSACNTGYGKLAKGEGVTSLAYAFAYAGCPSIVMSHWAVNDFSTKKIMLDFYEYLDQGHTKDKALQMAKINFIQTTDKTMANPAYWAPFVLIGNSTAIDLKKAGYHIWPLAVIALFIFSGTILLLLKRRSTLTTG